VRRIRAAAIDPPMASSDRGSHVAIEELRIEHRDDALGLGTARPRLSWTVTTDIPGWRQSAYELETFPREGRSRDRTGWVPSGESALVAWPFEPLSSRESVDVRVRVWGAGGEAGDWSDTCRVEAGLLRADDWRARFVTPDWDEDLTHPQPCPLLRSAFEVDGEIARARLYVTSLGVYEPWLNGHVVGDHVLAPGWTSYDHRLRYQTFDVTHVVRTGPNAIGAILGDGWYRGRIGFGGGRRNIWGERLALLAQLEVEYADGRKQTVVTDESWRACTGPILGSDLYDGETYDARLERAGWSEPGYDDADWTGVRAVERDRATLVAPSGPPVRRVELVAPVTIHESPSGGTIVDFGQNLVGRLRITVRGESGRTVTLRHAEVLEGGELCVRPLRLAEATDRYTLRGGGEESWEPRFTYHGFRYAEVRGWPGRLEQDDIRAVVCHSDLQRTGWFECSDPLVNRLHENVVWSMRGNFLDVPTDCPQRDERLGYTGDLQVFAPTATFLYDTAGMLSSWLADLAAEQGPDGHVPVVVPNVQSDPPIAAWGDAAVIVPWVLYESYGDTSILASQYESMKGWVDLVTSLSGSSRLWNEGVQLGDWVDPTAPPDKPWDGKTDRHLVATAYFARSCDLVAKAADVLGRADDGARYRALAGEVRDAFDREYVSPSGRVVSDSATAYSLALEFGLLREGHRRQRAADRLAQIVRENSYHIPTGFVGTPLICDALCHAGEVEAAYRLLTERTCPSWLYPITMGATTIWERWDSLRPDGAINPGEMTSFNHYALGAVAAWLHRTVAGLAPAAPGYRHISIAPRPGGGLTHARARHRTPYGMAESGWRIAEETIEIDAVIPPNTTATVSFPFGSDERVEVGSGSYHWSIPLPPRDSSVPPAGLASE
jgi:alpha-L-rhamnosidase